MARIELVPVDEGDALGDELVAHLDLGRDPEARERVGHSLPSCFELLWSKSPGGVGVRRLCLPLGVVRGDAPGLPPQQA